MYSTTAAFENWSARQELHLRSLGPKPSALAATLRAERWRTRRDLHPQPSRRQRVAPLIELRVQKWWEVLVTLQPSLPACLKTPGLQSGSRNTSRKWLVALRLELRQDWRN